MDYVGACIEQASTLNQYEYITLVATIESRFKDNFNCFKCVTQYGKKDKNVKKTLVKRKSQGCFDFTSKSYAVENIRFRSCVGNYTSNIDFISQAFSLYEKGLLPFKGDLGDQPNKIMEVFSLIETRREAHKES